MHTQTAAPTICQWARSIIVGTVFLASALTTAWSAEPPARWKSSEDISFDARFSTGYRVDQLDWNFSGNSVNVLSELEFSDITIYEARLITDVEARRAVFTWSAAYGTIVDGTVTDSDYAFDNRNGLFSRSKSECSGDYTLDLKTGLGYRFSLPGNRFHVIPLIGVSLHEQHLQITNGNQTVSTVPAGAPSWVPPASGTGPFAGLNSSYDTQWRSAWAGMRTLWEIWKPVALFGSVSYHRARYHAEANWNLRSDYKHPVSFEHDAVGYGIMLDAGGSLQLSKHWALLVTGHYAQWKAEDGTHRVYHSTGHVSELPLNEVNWTSQSISLSLRATF